MLTKIEASRISPRSAASVGTRIRAAEEGISRVRVNTPGVEELIDPRDEFESIATIWPSRNASTTATPHFREPIEPAGSAARRWSKVYAPSRK